MVDTCGNCSTHTIYVYSRALALACSSFSSTAWPNCPRSERLPAPGPVTVTHRWQLLTLRSSTTALSHTRAFTCRVFIGLREVKQSHGRHAAALYQLRGPYLASAGWCGSCRKYSELTNIAKCKTDTRHWVLCTCVEKFSLKYLVTVWSWSRKL